MKLRAKIELKNSLIADLKISLNDEMANDTFLAYLVVFLTLAI